MATRLAAYLDNVLDDPPAHCVAFVLRWVEQSTGTRIMPHSWGWTVRQWARHLAAHGGLVSAAETVLGRAGLAPCEPDQAQPGDVGIVEAPTHVRGRWRAVASIHTARGWAVISPGSITCGPFEAQRAWSLTSGRDDSV